MRCELPAPAEGPSADARRHDEEEAVNNENAIYPQIENFCHAPKVYICALVVRRREELGMALKPAPRAMKGGGVGKARGIASHYSPSKVSDDRNVSHTGFLSLQLSAI